MSTDNQQDLDTIERQIRDLGPWHLDVEVVPGLRTGDVEGPGVQAKGVSFVKGEVAFKRLMHSVYPHGLEGRSFLDVACNCGGYSLWASDIGAGRALGFDAREHWIRQAEFLAAQREPELPVEFHLGDVTKLDEYGWGSFDVTYFGGILYHLPFPMETLRSVADHTNELLYVNTASRPNDSMSGFVMATESTSPLMSGVHGLHWFPTGPNVVIRILEQLGFVEFRNVFNRVAPERARISARARRRGAPRSGRFAMLASKKVGLLT